MDFPNEHNVVQEPKRLPEKQDFQGPTNRNEEYFIDKSPFRINVCETKILLERFQL